MMTSALDPKSATGDSIFQKSYNFISHRVIQAVTGEVFTPALSKTWRAPPKTMAVSCQDWAEQSWGVMLSS